MLRGEHSARRLSGTRVVLVTAGVLMGKMLHKRLDHSFPSVTPLLPPRVKQNNTTIRVKRGAFGNGQMIGQLKSHV